MKMSRCALAGPSIIGIALLCFASSTLACSDPPSSGISNTWAPTVQVTVNIGNVPDVPVATALANWNAALAGAKCRPVLGQGPGSGQGITMSYGPIAATPECQSPCVLRGETDVDYGADDRISEATTTINSLVTVSATITEVVAHEFGHTFGLDDCPPTVCPVSSPSVMENGVQVSSVNVSIGQPGPTPCDITVVLSTATDYVCLPQPPPPDEPPCEPRSGPDQQQGPCSPIVLDLSGKGFVLTNAANGFTFDISGSGIPIRMGWTAEGANNAFLALPGPDGLVHNGAQLFGNFTPQPQSDRPNGFIALAVYDQPANGGNGDGVIDSRDAIYSSLRLWIDANHDGISQPEELHTLQSEGVVSISLNYALSQRTDVYGNAFRYKAAVDPNDPDPAHIGRTAYDIFFVADQPVAKCVAPPRETVLSSSTGGTFYYSLNNDYDLK